MGSESEGGKDNFQDIRKTSGRPLRITEVSPSATVFLNRQEGQEGLRRRRLGTDLEVPIDVCLPSTATDTYDFSQDQDDKSNTDLGSTFLDKGELLARVDTAVSRDALSTSSSPIHSEGFDDREGLTIPFEAPPNIVAHISRAFKDQGVGEPLAEFICGSLRESTKVQYRSAWVSWCRWCDGRNFRPTAPSVGEYVRYVWHLYHEIFLAWSSIRMHRAAVATILEPLTSSPVSQHPMVNRFMRAVYQNRPPQRKLKPIWDVAQVLRMLMDWGPASTLDRVRVTWRLTMLLALASARRASDLTLMHVGEAHMFKSRSIWRFSLVFGAKQDRPGHIPPDVILSRQSSSELCPLTNLEVYLERTETDRSQDYQLLRTTVNPFGPAARTTSRAWLSKVLQLADIEATGGSTRAAAATWASARAVPIATIMSAADWSSISTLSRHYIRNLPVDATATEHLSVQQAIFNTQIFNTQRNF